MREKGKETAALMVNYGQHVSFTFVFYNIYAVSTMIMILHSKSSSFLFSIRNSGRLSTLDRGAVADNSVGGHKTGGKASRSLRNGRDHLPMKVSHGNTSFSASCRQRVAHHTATRHNKGDDAKKARKQVCLLNLYVYVQYKTRKFFKVALIAHLQRY